MREGSGSRSLSGARDALPGEGGAKISGRYAAQGGRFAPRNTAGARGTPVAEDVKRVEDMPDDARAAARNIGDTLKRQIPEMSGPMSPEESRQQMRGHGPQTVQGGPERHTLPNLDERFAQESPQPDAPGMGDWRAEAGRAAERDAARDANRAKDVEREKQPELEGPGER